MKASCLVLILGCLAWVAPVSAARAPKLLFRLDAPTAEEALGSAVVVIGDLDGDGAPDLAVGAPFATGSDGFIDGRAYLYSAASRDILIRLDSLRERTQLGLSLDAVGDIDGDGVPDLIIGAPYTRTDEDFGVGSAVVFSGATGLVLYNFIGDEPGTYMGWSVAGTGDLDGDGVPDFMIGTPYGSGDRYPGTGNVIVRSGATGQRLFKFTGENPGEYLGWSISGFADVDGDGVGDLLMGAPNASPDGHPQAGYVTLRSGKTGEIIRRIDGTEPLALLGRAVAWAGDLNGDGVPDFIVGAPQASPNGLAEAGCALVFSGANGGLLYRLDGPERFASFGSSVAGGLDVDGDGAPDIVVGAPDASPGGRIGAGSVFVFSGATGELLFRWDGEASGDNFGRAVAMIGDLNADDRAEVLVGAPFASPGGRRGAGSVFVVTY